MKDHMTEKNGDSAITGEGVGPALGQKLDPAGFGGAGRLDAADDAWPVRPWILAAICALAGLIFYHLVEADGSAALKAAAQGGAAFIGVASLTFALGVERRRWHWAAGFSLFWGVVIGLIIWQLASYSLNGDMFGWPVFSALLAVLIATPFFQARRDVAGNGRQWRLWDLPYARLHDHAWTDAVIGAAGVAFAGITLLLLLLIGGMFGLIGITFISKLMEEGWFILTLAGAGFGGAVGLLRERDRLVSVLQRLVMVVLSILAPVLAAAISLFLLSLPGTGLAPLWESGFSATVVMLLASAASVLLANAVIGNLEAEQSGNRLLKIGAAVLVAAVLPMSLMAAVAMGLRVGQYGWTPERLWGASAVGIAVSYGAVGLWSVARARGGYAVLLRPLQQKLAIGVMLLAAILALPVFDFGAFSARDQLARLESGRVALAKFDWTAMAFDYGPKGRDILRRIAASDDALRAKSASAALAARDRWRASSDVRASVLPPLEQRVRILPQGAAVEPEARRVIEGMRLCDQVYMCALYVVDGGKMILLSQYEQGSPINQQIVVKTADGGWSSQAGAGPGGPPQPLPDLKQADIRIDSVERRRLMVGGQGQEVFE